MASSLWPWWVTGWLVLSSIVVLWDVGFVLNRPRSMEGGDLAWIWAPYPNYYNVDRAYGDVANPWIVAQTYGNIIESALNFLCVGMHLSGSAGATPLMLITVVMTLWKVHDPLWHYSHHCRAVLTLVTQTILYMGVEACSGWHNIGHNTAADLWLYFIIPNGFWIVLPFAITLFGYQQLSLASCKKQKEN